MMVSLGLIALGTGYIVYVNASREKEGLKLLGQVIGIVVMVAALGSVICGAARCAYKNSGSTSQCPIMAKMNCPMSGDSTAK